MCRRRREMEFASVARSLSLSLTVVMCRRRRDRESVSLARSLSLSSTKDGFGLLYCSRRRTATRHGIRVSPLCRRRLRVFAACEVLTLRFLPCCVPVAWSIFARWWVIDCLE
jgi:hypothetical protein